MLRSRRSPGHMSHTVSRASILPFFTTAYGISGKMHRRDFRNKTASVRKSGQRGRRCEGVVWITRGRKGEQDRENHPFRIVEAGGVSPDTINTRYRSSCRTRSARKMMKTQEGMDSGRREGDLNSRGAEHQQLSRLPPFRTRLSRPAIIRGSADYQTADRSPG